MTPVRAVPAAFNPRPKLSGPQVLFTLGGFISVREIGPRDVILCHHAMIHDPSHGDFATPEQS